MSPPATYEHSIVRNSVYGTFAFIIPTAITLLAYPTILHRIGAASFGLYIVAISANGIVAIFDCGIASAVIKLVAEDRNSHNPKRIAQTILAALVWYTLLGLLGTALMVLTAPWLATLTHNATSNGEAISVFRTASCQILPALLTNVLLSILKGGQHFKQACIVATWVSLCNTGSIMLCVLIGIKAVHALALAAVIGSYFSLVISVLVVKTFCRSAKIVLSDASIHHLELRRLFKFGSAIALHSMTTQACANGLRLLIAFLLGTDQVALYSIAQSATSKLHALVAAATEILFPVASGAHSVPKVWSLYRGATACGIAVMICGIALLRVFARPLLVIWLGKSLATQVLPLVQILGIAYLVLSLSAVPYYLLNGINRPWINVKMDLLNILILGLFLLAAIRLGVSTRRIAWAFAGTSVLTVSTYIWYMEVRLIRRRSACQFLTSGEG